MSRWPDEDEEDDNEDFIIAFIYDADLTVDAHIQVITNDTFLIENQFLNSKESNEGYEADSETHTTLNVNEQTVTKGQLSETYFSSFLFCIRGPTLGK